MTIEWNKVTWYSKLAAVILFVGVFWLGFWLGTMHIEKVYVNVPHVSQNTKSTAYTIQAIGGKTNQVLIEKQKCEDISSGECVPSFTENGCGWVSSQVGAGRFMFPSAGEVYISGQPKELKWEMVNLQYSRFDFAVTLIDQSGKELGYISEANWWKDTRPFVFEWDFKTLNTGIKITDGEYKLRFSYRHQCNADVTMLFNSNYFKIEAGAK